MVERWPHKSVVRVQLPLLQPSSCVAQGPTGAFIAHRATSTAIGPYQGGHVTGHDVGEMQVIA